MSFANSRIADLPHLPALPEFGKLSNRMRELDRDHRDADALLYRLQTVDRPQAEEKDRLAYAAALRSGASDPGTPETERVEVELAATERRVAALSLAVQQETAAFAAEVEAHREGWAGRLAEREQQARTQYESAIDRLEQTRQAWVAARADVRWLG